MKVRLSFSRKGIVCSDYVGWGVGRSVKGFDSLWGQARSGNSDGAGLWLLCRKGLWGIDRVWGSVEPGGPDHGPGDRDSNGGCCGTGRRGGLSMRGYLI